MERRLSKGIVTTEDSVRYTFFASLLSVGFIGPENVVLEYPHPEIDRAKIDTWLPNLEGDKVAIEFKYDRSILNAKNSPRTQKVGKVFNDLRRLEMLNCRGILVYLTDDEMLGYLLNRKNGFHEFFELELGKRWKLTSDFLISKSKTFLETAGDLVSLEAECLASIDLPRQHFLKIYEVHSCLP